MPTAPTVVEKERKVRILRRLLSSGSSPLAVSRQTRFPCAERNLLLAFAVVLICFLASAVLSTTASLASPPPALPSAATATPTPLPTAGAWDRLSPEIRAKVDPRILEEFSGQVIPVHLGGRANQAAVSLQARKPLDKTRFLVYLKAKADLQAMTTRQFATTAARRSAVARALVTTAQASQAPLKTLLTSRQTVGQVTSYQPFYIFNGLAVEGDQDTLIALAARDDVERIVANYPLVPLESSRRRGLQPGQQPGWAERRQLEHRPGGCRPGLAGIRRPR